MRRLDGELQPCLAFAQRFGVRAQRPQRDAELSRSRGDPPAQAPVQKYQEGRRNEDACERRREVVPVARRDWEAQRAAEPTLFYASPLFGRDALETALYEIPQLYPAFADGPMKAARVERRALAEFFGKAELEKQRLRGSRVPAEEAGFFPAGGLPQQLRGRVRAQRLVTALCKPIPAGAPGLDPDCEAAHRGHIVDAADAAVEIDARLDRRVGRRQFVEPRAPLRVRERLEDVVRTGLDAALSRSPVHAYDLRGNAGLPGPELPLVLDDALQAPVLGLKQVWRVVDVGDDGEFLRGREDGRRRGAHGPPAGRQPARDSQHALQDGPASHRCDIPFKQRGNRAAHPLCLDPQF